MRSSPGRVRQFALSLMLVLLPSAFVWHFQYINSEVNASSRKDVLPSSLRLAAGKPSLKQRGLFDRIRPSLETASPRDLDWQTGPKPPGLSGSLQANNSAQSLKVSLTQGGVQITPGDATRQGSWQLGIRLRGAGYGNRISEVVSGPVTARGNRIELRKSLGRHPRTEFTEWYINRREGLEHGFTLETRPGVRRENEPVRLVLELTGSLKASLVDEGQTVKLSRPDVVPVIRYDHLKAFDALGRRLAARMELREGQLSLLVDDLRAIYPVTIDPLFTEIKKLIASDGGPDHDFGNSVAISGDTVVVGALFSDAQAGSAYIYQRNQGGPDNWGEVKKLTASDAAAGDTFGSSVGINVDTVVVGALSADSADGAAYIFERNSGGANNWGEVKKLSPSNGTSPYRFGTSVGIGGDTVIIGAPFDSAIRGSAFLFERNSGGANNWGETKRLTAPDGLAGDEFGISVAISGDSAVVGADLDDATKGSAYIFGRNTGGVGNWGQVKRISASDGLPTHQFGSAVELNVDIIVVGAALHDGAKGSAYIYERNAGGANNWGEVKRLTASDGASSDNFGNSVRVHGDLVVVGAGGNNLETGAAYIFGRNTGGANQWGEFTKVTASDGSTSDQFGFSVGITGSTVIVGAHVDDLAKGAAYLYALDTQQAVAAVRFNAATIQRGQIGTATIDLLALGGPNPERTARFSLAFDPTQLVFISAVLGSGALDATLSINSSLSALGQVGLDVAKPPAMGFTAGTHQIVVVTFLALADGTLPLTTVAFVNTPVGRELIAVDGALSTTIWETGIVTISGGCASTVSPLVSNFSAKTGLGTMSVTIGAGCAWQTLNFIPWVAITAGENGIGNGTVNFTVDANAGVRRTGVFFVAGHIFSVRQGANFLDVAQDHIFYEFIGKLSAAAITLGCDPNGPLFCPTAPVSREQMAAFIIRALGNFTPSPPVMQRFDDVPPSHIFYGFIDDMAVRGITLGCSAVPPRYCPTNIVTREQMAAFLIRALGAFNPPPPAMQRFDDVPPSHIFYAFIDQMAVRGITLGCSASPPLYCPTAIVTREQMAAFLVRAFLL